MTARNLETFTDEAFADALEDAKARPPALTLEAVEDAERVAAARAQLEERPGDAESIMAQAVRSYTGALCDVLDYCYVEQGSSARRHIHRRLAGALETLAFVRATEGR